MSNLYFREYVCYRVISRMAPNLLSRKNPRIFTAFLFAICFATVNVSAQQISEKTKIIQETNVTQLKKLKDAYAINRAERKKKAYEMAAKMGWELTKVNEDGSFMTLEGITRDNKPLYYITQSAKFFNLGGANTTKASSLWTGGSLGLDLNGEGMVIGEWDGGAIRASHQEFDANDVVNDGTTSLSTHATHVGATMVGLGTNPQAKGMASEAALLSHFWDNDESEMAAEAANGLILSNHSYGFNPQFLPTWFFGYYDTQAQEWDNIQFNAPFYLVVKSAGNDRNVWNTSKGGYDLVNAAGASKNTLVVAAVEEVTNYTGPSSVVMSNFSSWGPTDDGRIKPDISAKGVSMFSASSTSNTAYVTFNGTSMAAPNTTGSLALVQQHYNNLNGAFMRAATLKAVALNTAEEAGDAPGPDYEFGWGLLNVENAANLVTNEGVSSIIDELTLSDGGTYSTTVTSDGTTPLDLTLVWHEEGSTPGPEEVADNPLRMLINDLDVRITMGSTTYEPWIMDPANPSAAATTGDNVLDNVETINIEAPAAGTYTVTVTHKGTLSQGTQNFSLVINGVNAGPPPTCEALVPSGLGSSNITENAADISWSPVALVDSYDYRYRATGAATWTEVNTTSTSASLSGLTPETEYEFQVRSNCTDESSAYSASSLFTTTAEPLPCTVTTPTGLAASGITDTSADIAWDAVAEATTYNYRYRATGTTTWTDGSSATTSASISGLTELTEYEVQVNAECPDETSAFSASVTFTTLEGSNEQPCDIAPQNISATSTDTTSDLTWDPVENANFYQYRYRPAAGGAWTNGTTTTNSLSLTGLTASTAYVMNMRTSCSTGTSPVATFNWSTTDGGGATCDVPTGLSSSGITQTEATISWSAVTGADDYNYRYRATGAATWNDASTAATSAALTGLTADTEYEFQVQTNCTSESSEFSPSATFTTLADVVDPCDIPGGLSASGITTSEATISWSAASGANSYNYRYRIDGSGAWTDANTTSTSADLTGLAEGTTYEFQIESVCDAGTSGYSASATFTTDTSGGGTTPCTEVPQNFVASTTASTASLSWSPVEGAILYQWRYRSTGAWTVGTTSTNSLDVSGLAANTTYTFMYRTWCGSFSPIATETFTTSSAGTSLGTNAVNVDGGISLERGLSVYPNPARSSLSIGLRDIANAVSITIMDTKGVIVRSLSMNAGIQEIDITGLSKGIYIINASNDNESITRRFIKE